MTMTVEEPTSSLAPAREWSGNLNWPRNAACKDDDRFIDRNTAEKVIVELIAICQTCPVLLRCRLWAEAQTQPVGFVVAGGLRWKAWNHCSICGKKVRGVDRCSLHAEIGEPIGTIGLDGRGRPYQVTDAH